MIFRLETPVGGPCHINVIW